MRTEKKVFYKKLTALVFPIAIQNLMTALVSASDALMLGFLDQTALSAAYYMIGKSINSTVVAGIFCGGGDTKFGFVCDAVTMWLIIIPLGAFAAFILHLPVLAVYFLLNLDELVKLPAVYRHYKQYKWVKNLTANQQ